MNEAVSVNQYGVIFKIVSILKWKNYKWISIEYYFEFMREIRKCTYCLLHRKTQEGITKKKQDSIPQEVDGNMVIRWKVEHLRERRVKWQSSKYIVLPFRTMLLFHTLTNKKLNQEVWGVGEKSQNEVNPNQMNLTAFQMDVRKINWNIKIKCFSISLCFVLFWKGEVLIDIDKDRDEIHIIYQVFYICIYIFLYTCIHGMSKYVCMCIHVIYMLYTCAYICLYTHIYIFMPYLSEKA